MGGFKIGAQVCNNCVHWQCHAERKFCGNPPIQVYTTSSCDKCSLTGRNTLSDGTCAAFSHIGGVTKTFAYVPEPSIGETYMNGLMDELKAKRDAQIAQARERRERERKEEREKLVNEVVSEMAKSMSGMADANNRATELTEEGMDYRNQFTGKAVEFMQMLDRAKQGRAEDQYRFAKIFLDGSHGAIKEYSRDDGTEYFRMSLHNLYSPSYRWCKKAADQGYPPAEFLLATFERDGKNEGRDEPGSLPEVDYVAALKWFEKAVQHGHEGAKEEYGRLKRKAFGDAEALLAAAFRCMVSNEQDKCVSLLKRASGSVISEKDDWGYEKFSEMLSDFIPETVRRVVDDITEKAESGLVLAQSVLGRLYVHEEGFDRICPEDFALGYSWLLKAREKGDEFATEYLRLSPKVQEYEAGRKIARDLDENDVASLLKVGRTFQWGTGVKEDKAKAASYYKKAVSLGSREAKYLLGECENDSEKATALFRDAAMKWFPTTICDNGRDDGLYNHYGAACREVAKDYEGKDDAKNAAKWFRFAARSGSYAAAKSLGYDYWKGSDGFDVDLQKAVYWLQIASWLNENARDSVWGKDGYLGSYLKEAKDQLDDDCEGLDELVDEEVFIEGCKGDPESQYEIGCWMYEGDQGFSEDVCAAMAWWYRAAMQGYVQAQLKIADMLFKGCDDVEKNEKEAFKWYCKAAEQNDPSAQNRVGFFYVKGCGDVEKNGKAAFEWRMKAAEQGYAKAQVNVGIHYAKGLGCEQDLVKAFSWFAKAAEQSDAQGNMYLARCYEKGEGCDPDVVKAVAHYQKAVEKKHATACNNLAIMYEKGHGVEKNLEKALELLKIAAEKSPGSRSCYHLGRFYENGLAVEADIAKAKEYYRKAADKGDKDAKAALERLG